MWRPPNTAYTEQNIVDTTKSIGDEGGTVQGCFFNCKMNLYALDGNMTGQIYRNNVIPDIGV